jgi:uncharacterized membrane protein YwaF
MGPWPVYIFGAALLGLLLFMALAVLARAQAVSPSRR